MKFNDPQHYFLIAANVMFRDPDMPDSIGTITLNTTSRLKTKTFPAKEIGRAQTAVQMMAFQKLGDPKIEMIDVTIMSISYLGQMTEKQFLEGTEQQTQPALNS